MNGHEMLPAQEQSHGEIIEVLVEVGEVGLDAFLEDGILRDLPVLGAVVKAIKTAGTMRDYLFARKITLFLRNLQSITEQEKDRFRERLQNDPIHQKRTGETLILILDRLNDLEKPAILAKVFEAYVKEKITFDTFKRIASGVDAAFIGDLQNLTRLDQRKEESMQCLRNLIASGLSQIEPLTSNTVGAFVVKPELSSAGAAYLEIMQDLPHI